MGASRQQTKERAWKPRLKSRGRKAQTSDSGSAQAASAAMSNIKSLERRRDRGDDIDEVYLAKVSQSIDPTAAAKQRIAAIREQAPTPGWVKTATVAGSVMAVVLLGMTIYNWSRYSVAGVVLVNKRPLANATVCFYPADSTSVASRVTTSRKGTFENARLPAGTYKVTVQPGDESKDTVQASYTKPESTQLTLKVEKDIENVWMHVSAAN